MKKVKFKCNKHTNHFQRYCSNVYFVKRNQPSQKMLQYFVQTVRQDYFIVRPPAHYNGSEHSGNSNSPNLSKR